MYRMFFKGKMESAFLELNLLLWQFIEKEKIIFVLHMRKKIKREIISWMLFNFLAELFK